MRLTTERILWYYVYRDLNNNREIGSRSLPTRKENATNELSERIISLLLATRKASGTTVGAFGLRERFLFCLRNSPQPPRELMDALCMNKSNLALLAKSCIEDGFITKARKSDDMRTLTYSLTEKGNEYLSALLSEIERKFDTVITDEKEKTNACENLDGVIELLSYL